MSEDQIILSDSECAVTCDATCNGLTEPDEKMLARHGLVKIKGAAYVHQAPGKSKGAVRQARRRERLEKSGIRDVTLPVPEKHIAELREVAKKLKLSASCEPQTIVIVPQRLVAVIEQISASPHKDPISAMEEAWLSSLSDDQIDQLERKERAEMIGEMVLSLTGRQKLLVERVLGKIDGEDDCAPTSPSQ